KLLGKLAHLAREERAVAGFRVWEVQRAGHGGLRMQCRFQRLRFLGIDEAMGDSRRLQEVASGLHALQVFFGTEYLQQSGALLIVELMMLAQLLHDGLAVCGDAMHAFAIEAVAFHIALAAPSTEPFPDVGIPYALHE